MVQEYRKMPEKHVNELNINLTLAPEVDQSNATAPQIESPIIEQPPSYESTLPQNTSSEPSGFVPSTEIYVGQQRFQRHRSRGRVGKTMQVGNATYTDLRHDCIEAFCEDCQKRVSRGLTTVKIQ